MSNCHPLEVVCRDGEAQLWANVDPWIVYHRDQLTNNCSTTKFKYFGKEANIIYIGPPPLFFKTLKSPCSPKRSALDTSTGSEPVRAACIHQVIHRLGITGINAPASPSHIQNSPRDRPTTAKTFTRLWTSIEPALGQGVVPDREFSTTVLRASHPTQV